MSGTRVSFIDEGGGSFINEGLFIHEGSLLFENAFIDERSSTVEGSFIEGSFRRSQHALTRGCVELGRSLLL